MPIDPTPKKLEEMHSVQQDMPPTEIGPSTSEAGGEFKAGDGDLELTQMTEAKNHGGAAQRPQSGPQAPPAMPVLNYRGMTMSAAAAKGDLPHVVLLWGMASARGINIMRPDQEGNNPMHYAALAESPEVASFLMQETRGLLGPGLPLLALLNADGETPLLRAAAAGNVPTIRYLVESGSSLLASDHGNGNSVLHNAARNGHLWALTYLLATAARAGMDKDTIKRFCEAPDKEDHTCLEWACFNGHLPVVQFLIRSAGMDPNRTDTGGRTCLHLAARQFKAPVVAFLVGNMKMCPRVKDHDGRDAYAYAKGDRDVLEAFATPKAKDEKDALRPVRRNAPRLGMVLAYAVMGSGVWLLPFFMPWFAYLPLLLAVLFTYRRVSTTVDKYYEPNHNPLIITPPRKMTLFGQWATAHEAFLGFWFGTLLGFAVTYPVLDQWPASLGSWLSESASSPLHPALTQATATQPLLLAFYVSGGLALLFWAHLVMVKPDPGAIVYEPEDMCKIVEEVLLTGMAPAMTLACYTCAIKKPLRSKHCGHCGFCISRMDHHCMWLDGCVGSHNHVRFLSFLTLHVLSCGLYAAFALFVLKGAVSAELAANALGSGACQVIRVLLLRPIFPLLVLCGFAAMCVAGLGFLLVDQLINLCRNLTTNEKINMARYPWLVTPEGRFHNRFDRGFVGNVLEFFGHKAYRRDYAKVYEVPPLSECIRKSPVQRCGEQGCCPAPNAALGASAYAPHHQHDKPAEGQKPCCEEGEHCHAQQEAPVEGAAKPETPAESNMV